MAIIGKTYICPFCLQEFVAVKRKQYTCGEVKCQHKWQNMRKVNKLLQQPVIPEAPPLPLKISPAAGRNLAQRQGIYVSGLSINQISDAARSAGKSYGQWVAEQQIKYEKENGIGMYAEKWR